MKEISPCFKTMILDLPVHGQGAAMLRQLIDQLDPQDQDVFKSLTAKYPLLAEVATGYLRRLEFERLKAELETDISQFGITKSKWLEWYEENVTRYDQMAADLEQAKGTISLLAAELAVARDNIREQSRHRRQSHRSEQQIPLFHAA